MHSTSTSPRRRLRALAVALTVALTSTAALLVSPAAGAGPTGDPQVAATGPTMTARTRTVLVSPRNPAYSAQPGAVIAIVKGSATLGTPTGSVDFYLDGQYGWTTSLDAAGRARFTYAAIGVGTYAVTAAYSGDATYASSASAKLVQTVLATAPTTSLSYTPAAVAPGAVSRLVLSATNNTPVNIPGLAMGLILPAGARVVSTPPGVGCRRAYPSLFYCLTYAGPGTTRKLVIDVTAPASSTTITTSGYARNIDTMEESGATATLVVK